ncbi:hypothetical protein GQX74_011143 [Glossina fuscipes]|nr:hypothetical protein GQX74_011143 [Glossina fuscipes]
MFSLWMTVIEWPHRPLVQKWYPLSLFVSSLSSSEHIEGKWDKRHSHTSIEQYFPTPREGTTGTKLLQKYQCKTDYETINIAINLVVKALRYPTATTTSTRREILHPLKFKLKDSVILNKKLPKICTYGIQLYQGVELVTLKYHIKQQKQ